MKLGFGLSLVTQGGGAPAASFTPADLFASGEVGALYINDLENFQQNADGTGDPAVGSPVGYWEDLSGNSDHATQGTTAAKPTLRLSGDVYRVEIDGVDDNLIYSPSSLPQPFTFACAARYRNVSGNGDLYRSTNRDAVSYTSSGDANKHAIFAGNVVLGSVSADTNDFVRVDQFNGASSFIRLNGSEIASGDAGADPLTSGTSVEIGRGNVTNTPEIDFYFIMFIDRVLTSSEISQLEAWIADRVGVTL